MNHDQKRSIEIEDLVRLKRAERPPAEFWSEFDRQLRAKQLAALVAKRPWWQTLPRVFTGFTRYHVPLGAAAILAVTFVTLRDHRSPGASESSQAAVRAAVDGAAVVVASPAVVAETPAPATFAVTSTASDRSEASAATTAPEPAAATSLASEATSPGELSRIIPLLGAPGAEPAANENAEPRYVASSFASTVKPEPVLSRSLLAANNGFESRATTTTRPAVEPLHQMTPPSERSRSRMFTAMVATVPAEMPSRASDRVVGRLDEERLYEQVRRFGARGAGMSISF